MPAATVMVPDEPDAASRKRRYNNDWNDVDLTDSTSEGSLSPKVYIDENVSANVNGAVAAVAALDNENCSGEKPTKKGKTLIYKLALKFLYIF